MEILLALVRTNKSERHLKAFMFVQCTGFVYILMLNSPLIIFLAEMKLKLCGSCAGVCSRQAGCGMCWGGGELNGELVGLLCFQLLNKVN